MPDREHPPAPQSAEEWGRRLLDAVEQGYRQLEAQLELHAVLPLRMPLPPLGRFTVGADFAVLMVGEILRRRPAVIAEAGSGVSTVLAGYCLERLGHGRIVSLEHDKEYCDQTRRMLRDHGFAPDVARVSHAPLRSYRLGGADRPWYALDALEDVESVDLLVVDGPPRRTGPLARYPALPLLAPKLAPAAVVLLDDSYRRDEAEIVERWSAEFPGFRVRPFETQKGATLFERGGTGAGG